MLAPVYTRQFAKDLKRSARRGKELGKFKIIARTLLSGKPLDQLHRDHRLIGNYQGRRECHIEADWIIFERMGSHADLFKK